MLHAIVGFILVVISSLGVAHYGRYRKFGYWGYFFASLLLTPLIGVLLVVSSDEPNKDNDKKSTN